MIIEATLISFAKWLGSKIADKGFDEIYSKLNAKESIDEVFYQCIDEVGKKFEKKYPGILDSSISYFFKKEEVFNELCKLLFINQDVKLEIISESFHLDSLPQNFIYEFIIELKELLLSKPEFNQILTNKEIFVIVTGVAQNVKLIAENSSLTINEIKTIQDILKEKFNQLFKLDDFLKLYKKNLINNLSVINFIGLGVDPSIKKGKRKKINELFIKPLFTLKSKHHANQEKINKVSYSAELAENGEKQITYDQLFDRPYNFVILGSPGAGKSLLIRSIICDIVSNKFSNSEIQNIIPFLIELRNYHAFKKQNGGNLIHYLSFSLENEFAMSNITEDNLIGIFKNQKTILFFDGLDEIFSESDKTHIKNDIETFHNRFPKSKSITTSRFIGYNEVKLNEELFCELSIKSFNTEQIIKYIKKWYLLEEDNVKTREHESNNFIANMSKIDIELISNPLLLTLIVILYRNNLKIPESKLEIYQSCTNTLVDKWDANKNLEIKLNESVLQKKEPIFSDLAIWQYETLSSKNTNVTYLKARETVAKSLIRKKEADEYNCNKLAELFLSYAQKRSIYFDNNFTHKTFLEYYSAYWIFTNIEKKHNVPERNRLISKYISNPFWFIVLELLINMIDNDQPDTEIIDELFNLQLKEDNSLSFLIYILPSIKNVSKEMVINIYHRVILFLIKTKKISFKRKGLFNKLYKNIDSKIHNEYFNEAFTAIATGNRNLNYYILLNEIRFMSNQKNIDTVFHEIITSSEYSKFLRKDSYLYQIDRARNSKFNDGGFINDIIEYQKLFGIKEIFKDHLSRYDSYIMGPIIGVFFHFQFKDEYIKKISFNLKKFENASIPIMELIKYVINERLYINMKLDSVNYLCKQITKKEITDKEKTLFLLVLRVISRNYFSTREIKINDITTTSIIKKTLKDLILRKVPPLEIIIKNIGIIDEDIINLSKKNKYIKMI